MVDPRRSSGWSPARYRRGRLAGALLCALPLLPGAGGLVLAAPRATYRDRPLAEVLHEFQERGLELIFSSAVVGQGLRITVEPAATRPRAILDEILPPLGLSAEDGPGGTVLILAARREPLSLVGRVLSVARHAPIAGAAVRVSETGHAATTDAYGVFELRDIPPGRYELTVEARGFWPATIPRVRVTSRGGRPLGVELQAQPAFVTEVVVTPGRHSLVRHEQASSHTVTGDDVLLAPTLGGDISRSIELLPGVAAPDNSAAFHMRGSLARDVSLVLDGLELYDPFHLESLQSPFSLVDGNVVDRVDFFGGGFTAELGDRHGGFVDISTVVPGETAGGEIEIGTSNSRASYRGPTTGQLGSWLFSLRGWYPDAVLASTELGGGENLDPQLVDLYAKAAFHLSPRTLLFAHSLMAYDRLKFDESGEDVNESVDVRTRDAYAWVRLLTSWAEHSTSETLLSGGRIERRRDGVSSVETGPLAVDDDRDVDFFGLEHDSTWQLAEAHVLKSGVNVRWLRANYHYTRGVPEDPTPRSAIRIDPQGTSVGAYAAYRARVSESFATELGLRWDRQSYTNDDQVGPRLNASWQTGRRSELRLALGRFNQSQRIHELHVEDDETEFGRAEVAEQAELSFQQGFRRGLRIRIDAYLRKLSQLRPRYENLFEPIELFPETTEDRVMISAPEARLRGLEFLMRWESSAPVFWWASYALSSADDLEGGRHVPRSWDQTHAGRFLVGYRRDDRWSVVLSGSAHTGWPTTPVSAQLVTLPDGSTEVEPIVGSRNSDRFPYYARLDFKARRSFALPRGSLWLTLEIVNLTDRENACCVDEFSFEPQRDGTVDVERELDSWLGFAPSFSVLWEF